MGRRRRRRDGEIREEENKERGEGWAGEEDDRMLKSEKKIRVCVGD
ncbi:hypothetical protein LINPERPRIM_LOCUS6508 [Linum perenne]